MKIESLREVKNDFSSVIDQLSETGPVVITKNGKGRAILLPVDESTALPILPFQSYYGLLSRAPTRLSPNLSRGPQANASSEAP